MDSTSRRGEPTAIMQGDTATIEEELGTASASAAAATTINTQRQLTEQSTMEAAMTRPVQEVGTQQQQQQLLQEQQQPLLGEQPSSAVNNALLEVLPTLPLPPPLPLPPSPPPSPPNPAIDPESLHPFLEATSARDLAEYMQVPLRALGCVELMTATASTTSTTVTEKGEEGTKIVVKTNHDVEYYVKCTAKDCPYPAAYRTASGNKNGTFPKCVLHNKQWYPKPPRKAHFLLGHEFLRPQNKEKQQQPSSSENTPTTTVATTTAARSSLPPNDTPVTQCNSSNISIKSNDIKKASKPSLPPCCWHCCCGDDYCKGIGYTPHARSIPVRHVEGVLEALPHVRNNPMLQQKIRLNPKNFSVAPWHFHPSARFRDSHGKWKLKPLNSTLIYAHSTGDLIIVDDKNNNNGRKDDAKIIKVIDITDDPTRKAPPQPSPPSPGNRPRHS